MVTTASTTVLSDRWTNDDKLGLADFRGILRDILTDGPTPITVGVFGDWGSGKTSLMRMLMDDVKSAGHRAVWFDAWKFTDESMHRALIQRIIDELRRGEDKKSSSELDDLELHLYQDTTRDQEGEITFDWRQALKGSVKLGISMLPVVGSGFSEIVKQFDTKVTGGVDDLVKSLKREQVKLHRDRYRFLDEFQTTFTTALAPLTRQQQRLIIFIDDLDRCLPDDALHILETVKLYLDAEGCAFVVGMDCRVIEQAIRVRYKDYAADQGPCLISGADYLEKLIQVPFHLPPIAPEKLATYITDLCPVPSTDVVAVCCAGLEPNPRQVKRAINVFRILWGVAEKQDGFNPELMMKLVVIQCRHNELFILITREPFVLKLLEERIAQYDSLNVALIARRVTEREMKASGKKGIHDFEEIEAPLEPPRDKYTDFAENEAIRKLLESGSQRFTKLPSDQLQKYVFLAGTTAVQNAEVSRDIWKRLTNGDEASMRGACAEIVELSETEQQGYRRRLLETIRATDTPAKTRCIAGNALAIVGDNRFHGPERWHLPTQDHFGFVNIPSGPFQMGNDQTNYDKSKDEAPRHEISLSTYYMACFPVTTTQFSAFTKANPTAMSDQEYLRGIANHPVVFVSWHEAISYCIWLDKMLHSFEQSSGMLFPAFNGQRWSVTLPSEAEWEKAARGVEARKFPWGDEWNDDRANSAAICLHMTSAVGCFVGGRSPYDIEEMSGNVWEWTRSIYRDYPYTPEEGREVQKGDDARVLRGGSWANTYPRTISSSCRIGRHPANRNEKYGFRCVVRLK